MSKDTKPRTFAELVDGFDQELMLQESEDFIRQCVRKSSFAHPIIVPEGGFRALRRFPRVRPLIRKKDH